jgi:hypothetical protein
VQEWRRILRRPKALKRNADAIYTQLFGNDPDGTVRLQLSHYPSLRPSILLVEEPRTGRVRSYYRNVYTSPSSPYYCAFCSTRETKRNEGKRVRVRTCVEERGVISHGNRCHRPECEGLTKMEIIVQQLRRRLQLWELGR